MSGAVICRGCGRRVVVPDRIIVQKARCPKCRTKLLPPAPADPPTPDPYRAFLEESQPVPVVAPAPPAPVVPEVLSLDDAIELEPLPATQTTNERAIPLAHLPPPFKFPLRVVSDSKTMLRGSFRGVLTPHGLFLESLPDRPLLYAPIGTKLEPEGPVVVVAFPDRQLTLRFAGVPFPEQLAADTAAFLAGQRPVPLPAEYRRPWWLAGVGAVLALGLAAGPVVLTEVADFDLWIGLVLGVVFAVLATLANAAIALYTRFPVSGKIGLMAGASVAVLGLFLFGAMAYLAGRNQQAEPPAPRPVEPPPAIPPPTLPPDDGTPRPPSEPHGPLSHIDMAYREGKTRLDDGPAEVTALAVSPMTGAVLIGHADGTTRVWHLDQPSFEPPHPGPRADGAVRRIEFDSTGKLALLTCDAGLVIAPLAAPPKAPLLIPGELVVAFLDPGRERFAAVRAGRVQVRYIPMDFVKDAPVGRAVKGFLPTTPKDETLPIGVLPAGTVPPAGQATFLAWHPTGRLLCGGADGTIATVPSGTPMPALTNRMHRAAVRAWAFAPWGECATGDDDGNVGFWPSKAATPTKFRAGAVGIKGLAFSPCGGELAVVDTAGWVSLWHPATGTKLFEVNQKHAAGAVAFGPHDDLFLIAEGKGVEVWWLPELAARSVK